MMITLFVSLVEFHFVTLEEEFSPLNCWSGEDLLCHNIHRWVCNEENIMYHLLSPLGPVTKALLELCWVDWLFWTLSSCSLITNQLLHVYWVRVCPLSSELVTINEEEFLKAHANWTKKWLGIGLFELPLPPESSSLVICLIDGSKALISVLHSFHCCD